MDSTIHDLLNELASWQREAAFGDNGERPFFDLSPSRDGKGWDAEAFSFYDGSGSGSGATPEEALAACIEDLRAADGRADAANRRWAIDALSRVLKVGHGEAARRIAVVEGWPVEGGEG